MSRLEFRHGARYKAARHRLLIGFGPRQQRRVSEWLSLSRLGERNIHGERICFAFGPATDGLSTSPEAYGHLFEITLNKADGLLTLTIDAYCANSPEFINAPDFDVDQWEAEKIQLYAPASRIGFKAMSQAARAVLKGRVVKIIGGTVSLDGFVSDPAEARP